MQNFKTFKELLNTMEKILTYPEIPITGIIGIQGILLKCDTVEVAVTFDCIGRLIVKIYQGIKNLPDLKDYLNLPIKKSIEKIVDSSSLSIFCPEIDYSRNGSSSYTLSIRTTFGIVDSGIVKALDNIMSIHDSEIYCSEDFKKSFEDNIKFELQKRESSRE